MTQGWKQPAAAAPGGDQRRSGRRVEELPRRRAGRGRRRGGRGGAGGAASPSAAGSTRSAGGCASCNRPCAPGSPRATPRRSASSTAIERALPDDAVVVCDMCIPGYWLGRLPPHAAARASFLPARLGHARLRLPAGAGRRAGRRRPGGEHLGRRRLPLRLRRAGDRRAGAHPAHRRDRGRRRLRDAPLRPGPRRRPARGRRPRDARLRGAGALVRRAGRRGRRARGALRGRSAHHVRWTSRRCSWRRPRWARRPTCRRAGTGDERQRAAPGAARRAGSSHPAPRRALEERRGLAHAPRARCVRRSARPILQTAVAASLAWLVATELVGHDQPFFAPISAVVTLGLTVGERRRRAVELAIGVAVGIAIADLLVAPIGTGTWQIGVTWPSRCSAQRWSAAARCSPPRPAPRPCWSRRSSRRTAASTSRAPSTRSSAAARRWSSARCCCRSNPLRLAARERGPAARPPGGGARVDRGRARAARPRRGRRRCWRSPRASPRTTTCRDSRGRRRGRAPVARAPRGARRPRAATPSPPASCGLAIANVRALARGAAARSPSTTPPRPRP